MKKEFEIGDTVMYIAEGPWHNNRYYVYYDAYSDGKSISCDSKPPIKWGGNGLYFSIPVTSFKSCKMLLLEMK